jgi:hypothetical protein
MIVRSSFQILSFGKGYGLWVVNSSEHSQGNYMAGLLNPVFGGLFKQFGNSKGITNAILQSSFVKHHPSLIIDVRA